MEFIREKTKDKPISKRKVLEKLGICALGGLIFALVAVTIFFAFLPKIKKELGEVAGAVSTEEQENQTQQESEKESEKESETESEKDSQEDSSLPEQMPEFSLDIQDYEELQETLYQIGRKANSFMVTVTGTVSDTDWLNNAYEMVDQGTGVVISQSDIYYYILTEKGLVEDTETIRVTFIDGSSTEASLLKYDATTGLTVLTVEKSTLSSKTLAQVQVATLGDSDKVTDGKLVLALGNLLGTNYSILTGNVTSLNNELNKVDRNYSVFTTNIIANDNARGVLINTDGEIVGMTIANFEAPKGSYTITVVAISEIRSLIENLCLGKGTPYMGVYISTVTEEISKQHEIPMGIFVRDVVADSPAMDAGLQSGDIILKVNGEDVATDTEYSEKISTLSPGDTCEIMLLRQNGNDYYEITLRVELGMME